jgi:hypothetical protein
LKVKAAVKVGSASAESSEASQAKTWFFKSQSGRFYWLASYTMTLSYAQFHKTYDKTLQINFIFGVYCGRLGWRFGASGGQSGRAI